MLDVIRSDMDVIYKIADMSLPSRKKLSIVDFWRNHIPDYSLTISPFC